MNSFQAAALACRLLALYFLFQALTFVSQFPLLLLMASHWDTGQGFGSPPSYTRLFPFLSYFFPFLLSTAFAAFLWIKSRWLAKRITADYLPLEGTVVALDYSGLQRVMLTIIGVFVLMTAIPEAARAIVSALLTPSDVAKVAGEVARVTAENWSLLLRFLLGFTLLFAAPAISNKLDRIYASR